MRYISVCSGIEAASVAWGPLGWEPVAFAEIDPFPNAVLAHRFPNVPNLGDISKVDWRPYAGTVDVVVGGTPCQSFSVIGGRKGLEGASGLVFEYFRLLDEVRPKLFLWENVPGAFSQDGGRAFQSILREWDKLGYSVAWRVLNAEHFGTPQHRRRIFALGHLGGWQTAAKILFEPEGLYWDAQKSLHTKHKAKSNSDLVYVPDVSKSLMAKVFARDPTIEDFIGYSDGTLRALTPLECERLQGFPDDWTKVPYRGKPAEECPDGPRYKALGNSMAVPCMRWIGERIQKVEDEIE